MVTVAKFGGTSVADAGQVRKLMGIVKSDPRRRYIVVSAPGKRHANDHKVTDLLIEWHRLARMNLAAHHVCAIIRDRFADIARELSIEIDIDHEFGAISKRLNAGASEAYLASRGEYLMGKIVAKALGYPFLDAADFIRFGTDGSYNPRSMDNGGIRTFLEKHSRGVIPGFYGARPDGRIQTFPRQGSDITGAIVAKAIGATLYENWKDVPGVHMADPRIVENPKRITAITYRELRELAYMGADVFHEHAVIPLQEANIASKVMSTESPAEPGTIIVPNGGAFPIENRWGVVGIAGRKDFTAIRIEKTFMMRESGFLRKALAVLESHHIPCAQCPGGIDAVSLIVSGKGIAEKRRLVEHELQRDCAPDKLEIFPHLAMIAVVGRGMAHRSGVAAHLFQALALRRINVRMISQEASEISILIGVRNRDCDAAIRAIYCAI